MDLSVFPKTAKLKDGTKVTLRPMVAEDLEALHHFFVEDVPLEDRLYLKDDVADRAIVEKWAGHIDYDRVIPLLMFAGDRIIGDGTLRHHAHGWSSHMAEVRLVVARDQQQKGAGILLLKELVQLAQAKNVDMIQAQVFENTPGGLTVFQRLGFRIEAVLRGFALDIKGERQNMVVLVRDVAELWTSMADLLWESDWRGDS